MTARLQARNGQAPLAASTQPALRVGHINRKFLNRSETFVYTLLCAHDRYDPLVLTRAIENLDEYPGIAVVNVGRHPGLVRRIAWRAWATTAGHRSGYDYRLARALKEHGCLLMHAHFGWSGSLALAAQRRVGLPLVTTFYGRDLSSADGADASPQPQEAYRDLFAAGAAFLCEGPRMAADLAALGCPADKIHISRIPIDLAKFPYRPRPVGEQLVFLQTARFVEKKGVDLTIAAYAKAHGQLGPSELWLIGDGELRDDLERLADESGVGQNIRFLGMVSHDRYRELLEHVDVCIQPSRLANDGDTEGGAPTVLLEMQATGIPLVATRHADIPAVVPPGTRLVDENDVDGLAHELARVARMSEPEREAITRRARDFVAAHHAADHVGKNVERIYDGVLRAENT